jgi:hypothetical protein
MWAEIAIEATHERVPIGRNSHQSSHNRYLLLKVRVTDFTSPETMMVISPTPTTIIVLVVMAVALALWIYGLSPIWSHQAALVGGLVISEGPGAPRLGRGFFYASVLQVIRRTFAPRTRSVRQTQVRDG